MTISWNCARTFRCRASASGERSGATSSSARVVCRQKRLGLVEFAQLDALHAFRKHKKALVGHLYDLVHRRPGADLMQIAALGGVLARVALGHHQDGLLFTQRLDQLDRALPPYRQRQNRMREKNRIPHRENRIRLSLAFAAGGLAGRLDHAYKFIRHN